METPTSPPIENLTAKQVELPSKTNFHLPTGSDTPSETPETQNVNSSQSGTGSAPLRVSGGMVTIFVYLASIIVVGLTINALVVRLNAHFNFIEKQREILNDKPHEIVIVGNSQSILFLNPTILSAELQRSVVEIHGGGVPAGWWYLAIKNIVLHLNPRPNTIIVPVLPEYVVNPNVFLVKYAKDPIAEEREPELEKMAKISKVTSPLSDWLSRTFSMVRTNDQLRRVLYEQIRDWEIALTTKKTKTANKTMNDTLKDVAPNRLPISSVVKLKKEEQTFENSFIPLIVNVAKKGGTQLIFVRVKQRDGKKQDDIQIAFMDKMQSFLQEQGIPYLDYSNDPRISEKDFVDDKHLSTNSQKIFNAILAQDLAPYLR